MSSTSATAAPSRFCSEFVKQLDPYVPGEQPKDGSLIKLNTNENPYPASPKVAAALSQDLLDLLRLYPDPESLALKQAVAKNCNLHESNVFVGNGSDEVLAIAFMTFFKQKEALLFPDITYSFYPVYCNLYDIETRQIPLAEDFTINFADYQQDNGGIIFSNPNAPTGIAVGLEEIEALLKSNRDTVVIVDEAYIDFAANHSSAAELVERYPNLLVVQTLSKSRSLAGLRVGYAIGSAELIDGLNRVKNSFNSYPVDRIAETAAVMALQDTEYFEDCCRRIINTRQWTTEQLQALDFEVLPSAANFIMVRSSWIEASELFGRLREKKIIVRYFDKPRIDQYLRISIGTDGEMQALINAIVEIRKK